MNFFSLIGDGEVFFYFCMVFFVLGNRRAFLYNATAYVITIYVLAWLKL